MEKTRSPNTTWSIPHQRSQKVKPLHLLTGCARWYPRSNHKKYDEVISTKQSSSKIWHVQSVKFRFPSWKLVKLIFLTRFLVFSKTETPQKPIQWHKQTWNSKEKTLAKLDPGKNSHGYNDQSTSSGGAKRGGQITTTVALSSWMWADP